eukprot:TRINITY_DN14780_c0_g1_i1.p1 TRINITY_DN14780_c0_g1~~TRINITY_DN14780_c0_g1_i1.p1  ORF type:complete len:415 (-),score=48.35 TRINITY_DN14780_c0_g1_i1:349-1593(-)
MGNCVDRAQVENSPGATSGPSSGASKSPNDAPSQQSVSSFSMKTNDSWSSAARSEGETVYSSSLKAFTYNELKSSTKNFRPDSLIGEGGFGSVFKGWIDEAGMPTRPGQGNVVAVKRLSQDSTQGHKEWLAEVTYLGQLHHPNLVRLIGYCAEDDHRLLVYEYMQKGSLENHLFRRGAQPLSWAIRIKVAIGAARGLAFLHDADQHVIYRDFKASNILLDSNFNSKLSDFGLAKDGPTGDRTHVSTRVMGTYGYAAPEYVATGRLTAKSDVYSFGVVLLELLSGRRAVEKNKPGQEQNLVEWAKPYLNDKGRLFRIMDTRLEGQYSRKGAQRAAQLALQCLNSEAKLRPLMKQVVETLEQLHDVREVMHSPESHKSAPKLVPSPRNRNFRSPSPGFSKPAASPLHSYQRSPRVH